jgi:hypothetical protein
MGFFPTQNIIANPLHTYSTNPNPTKPTWTNAAAAAATNKIKTLPAVADINIDNENYQHEEYHQPLPHHARMWPSVRKLQNHMHLLQTSNGLLQHPISCMMLDFIAQQIHILFWVIALEHMDTCVFIWVGLVPLTSFIGLSLLILFIVSILTWYHSY